MNRSPFPRLAAFLSLGGAFAFIGALAASSQGCTFSTGDGDASDFSFDSGKTDTGTPVGNQACNQCLFQQCSGQWAVCQQSSECTAIYQCATKTGCDQACVNKCFADHPSGQKEYTALYTCDQAGMCDPGCQSACGTNPASCPAPTTDAGQTDSGSTTDAGTAPLDCSGCTAQKCAAAEGKCATGSDCDKYTQCNTACADLACIDACGTQFPQGKTDSEALAQCTLSQCSSECGL